jgi:hypothetical protein
VVLADVKGSTEAVRAGRYKDVNLVGAACITAALNVTRDLDLPYAFGGDGATVLIAPDCLVFSLEESRHVRFIDGADGGYALAALQLKAQLQAAGGDDAGAPAPERHAEPGP